MDLIRPREDPPTLVDDPGRECIADPGRDGIAGRNGDAPAKGEKSKPIVVCIVRLSLI